VTIEAKRGSRIGLTQNCRTTARRREEAVSNEFKVSPGELLKQFKPLPPRERQKVFKAIFVLEENDSASLPMKTKPVEWPDVEARAKRIFGNRRLPNLVLLEREEEAF
jgi:hypothetical protein